MLKDKIFIMNTKNYNDQAEQEIKLAQKELNPGFFTSIFSSKIERFDNAETHYKKALNMLRVDKNCNLIRATLHRGYTGSHKT